MRYSLGHTLGFIVKVGLAAVVFIIFAKWLTKRVNVPGLSSAVGAV